MARARRRCSWAGDDELYVAYHDREWGRPVHDDRVLFEFLLLEGAQAGLSWITILRKRENYRRAFAGFDPRKVARFDAARVRSLMANEGIVRNRLKIRSAIANARAFLEVQEEFGSFDRYFWGFRPARPADGMKCAEALSRDLLKRGFRFVGATIIYAMMQACGVVNDHQRGCFLHRR